MIINRADTLFSFCRVGAGSQGNVAAVPNDYKPPACRLYTKPPQTTPPSLAGKEVVRAQPTYRIVAALAAALAATPGSGAARATVWGEGGRFVVYRENYTLLVPLLFFLNEYGVVPERASSPTPPHPGPAWLGGDRRPEKRGGDRLKSLYQYFLVLLYGGRHAVMHPGVAGT
ncbi:unnamed protein product [Laminaria digitata]